MRGRGVVMSSWGRLIIRGPAVLTSMCVQADYRGFYGPWSPLGCEDGLCDFKHVLSPLKPIWDSAHQTRTA
jgi:hypothetical protein